MKRKEIFDIIQAHSVAGEGISMYGIQRQLMAQGINISDSAVRAEIALYRQEGIPVVSIDEKYKLTQDVSEIEKQMETYSNRIANYTSKMISLSKTIRLMNGKSEKRYWEVTWFLNKEEYVLSDLKQEIVEADTYTEAKEKMRQSLVITLGELNFKVADAIELEKRTSGDGREYFIKK